MLEAQAQSVRALFSADTQTRNVLGGVPYSSDIVAELSNTQRYQRGEMLLNRPRTRLGQIMQNTQGEVIAYMSISVVLLAKPTAYEQACIWHSKYSKAISGIFIRKIVVKESERCQGYGAIFLDEVRRFARLLLLPMFCDVIASNMRMRKFVRREGGVESIFWSTPKGTPMVRYMWR